MRIHNPWVDIIPHIIIITYNCYNNYNNILRTGPDFVYLYKYGFGSGAMHPVYKSGPQTTNGLYPLQ